MSYVCVCVQSYCYTIQHFEQTRKLSLAGGMRFAESSISFMFSISISNITWIRRKRIKRLRHYLFRVTPIPAHHLISALHALPLPPPHSMACITVTGVVFVCHSRVLTIREQLCVVQWNVFHFAAIQWNGIPFDQCLNTWQHTARLQIMCALMFVCVCYQSDPRERKTTATEDTMRLSICHYRWYSCQYIFARNTHFKSFSQLDFPRSSYHIVCCCFCRFFSWTHLHYEKIHSFCCCCWCWDECCLICMCLVIIVTFCHISRLISLSV